MFDELTDVERKIVDKIRAMTNDHNLIGFGSEVCGDETTILISFEVKPPQWVIGDGFVDDDGNILMITYGDTYPSFSLYDFASFDRLSVSYDSIAELLDKYADDELTRIPNAELLQLAANKALEAVK